MLFFKIQTIKHFIKNAKIGAKLIYFFEMSKFSRAYVHEYK